MQKDDGKFVRLLGVGKLFIRKARSQKHIKPNFWSANSILVNTLRPFQNFHNKFWRDEDVLRFFFSEVLLVKPKQITPKLVEKASYRPGICQVFPFELPVGTLGCTLTFCKGGLANIWFSEPFDFLPSSRHVRGQPRIRIKASERKLSVSKVGLNFSLISSRFI